MISDFLNDLKDEFSSYSIKKLKKDMIAGLTVSTVALPLALAFGAASGASAASGVSSAIISGIIAGFFSGGFYQIPGPTGAMVVTLLTASSIYGVKGILITGFLAGLFLIIAGFSKLGKIIKFIPGSVILGFTSGIALTIMLGQIDNFFGTTSSGITALQKLWSYTHHGVNLNYYSILTGSLSILIMSLWPKKLAKTIPAPLITIIIMYIAAKIFNFDVPRVGNIPGTIFLDEKLSFSDFTITNFTAFSVTGFSIASLIMIESLMCGANVGKTAGKKLNSDRELIAHGISNMIIPFFGGMASTSAASRSSVSVSSGAVTRLATIFHSVFMILVILFLAPLISDIPLSILAGILMVVAFRMNKWDKIKEMFRSVNKTAIAKYLITMLASIVFNLAVAVILGVLYSMLSFIIKISDIDISVSKVDTEKLDGVSRDDACDTRVVYITGPIFFAAIEKMETELAHLKKCETVIFSLRGVPITDVSGMQAFYELIKRLVENDVKICFAAVQPKVMEQLKIYNITALTGEENIYWDANQALQSLFSKGKCF